MTTKREGKPQTIFQRLAVERNWYQGFMVKLINVGGLRTLKLSRATQVQLDYVNEQIRELKEMIDRDWKDQKVAIKKDLAKIAPQNFL